MPIINKLTEVGNINPLHMGVVIITTLVFGLITPPYGLSLLVASKYVGVGFGKAVMRSLPLYIVFFADDRVRRPLPRHRPLAAEAVPARIGRLLQVADRRRVHLPVTAHRGRSMNAAVAVARPVQRPPPADAAPRRRDLRRRPRTAASAPETFRALYEAFLALPGAASSRRTRCRPRRQVAFAPPLRRGADARHDRCTTPTASRAATGSRTSTPSGKPDGRHPDKGTL